MCAICFYITWVLFSTLEKETKQLSICNSAQYALSAISVDHTNNNAKIAPKCYDSYVLDTGYTKT